jgi:hypothetical protein
MGIIDWGTTVHITVLHAKYVVGIMGEIDYG